MDTLRFAPRNEGIARRKINVYEKGQVSTIYFFVSLFLLPTRITSTLLAIVSFDKYGLAKAKFNSGTDDNLEPPKEFVEHLVNDLESLKEFVQNIAFDIDGIEAHDPDEEIDVNGAQGSVIQYWKFSQLFIKEKLPEIIKMRSSKRPRRYGTKATSSILGGRCGQWTARVREYIESSCHPGSGRGLYYKDITFGVFRNEHGNVEFAMKVIRDAKNTTQTPDKRPEHSLYEGLEPSPLFCQPMLFILAILVAKGAFRDYRTIEELFNLVPPDEEMYPLQWDKNVVDLPFFKSMSRRASPGKIENATAFSGRFRGLGFRAGYAWPGTIHDYRALGLTRIHLLYLEVSIEKYAGQKDSNTFRNYYLPNLVADRQAEKQHEFENSQEYIDLDEQIISLIGKKDPDSIRRRREFLLEVAPLRTISLAALRDLVALYLNETEIKVRPGLEPEKCSCLTDVGEPKPITTTAYDWKHIYDCYKKVRMAEESYYNFKVISPGIELKDSPDIVLSTKPELAAVTPGDDQYIVERILSHKVNRPKGSKKGITQYLVKWEGYLDEENSLVDKIHEDLVRAYTATAEQLLRKRSVRLGRQKKMVT
ncbi:hypothetical protein G7Y89_g10811 [Cudoniella acicularis]|uniref:Chromo domain-containing protein n=1 Tax=Cudoniella acicularis TaxID=354080 RepID=A0A8H4REC8_9HELO|nr:hypothetical protein G7Y89_g10811 [Cudoniella acicularis]